LIIEKKWPFLLSKSDTTGEKDFEEFFVDGETLDLNRFPNLGIVKSNLIFDEIQLDTFTNNLKSIKKSLAWNKDDLLNEFKKLLPSFDHKETGKYLDSKM
jgi:hypothetical protein